MSPRCNVVLKRDVKRVVFLHNHSFVFPDKPLFQLRFAEDSGVVYGLGILSIPSTWQRSSIIIMIIITTITSLTTKTIAITKKTLFSCSNHYTIVRLNGGPVYIRRRRAWFWRRVESRPAVTESGISFFLIPAKTQTFYASSPEKKFTQARLRVQYGITQLSAFSVNHK